MKTPKQAQEKVVVLIETSTGQGLAEEAMGATEVEAWREARLIAIRHLADAATVSVRLESAQ